MLDGMVHGRGGECPVESIVAIESACELRWDSSNHIIIGFIESFIYAAPLVVNLCNGGVFRGGSRSDPGEDRGLIRSRLVQVDRGMADSSEFCLGSCVTQAQSGQSGLSRAIASV